MQITLFSLFMSVLWSSVLAAFNYFCRKKHFFIRQLGMTNVLFLYLFSIVRMLVPYKFSFTRVIPSQGAISDVYRGVCTNKIGTTQISFLGGCVSGAAGTFFCSIPEGHAGIFILQHSRR